MRNRIIFSNVLYYMQFPFLFLVFHSQSIDYCVFDIQNIYINKFSFLYNIYFQNFIFKN